MIHGIREKKSWRMSGGKKPDMKAVKVGLRSTIGRRNFNRL